MNFEIEDIKKINLEPGDTIVIKTKDVLSKDVAEKMYQTIENLFVKRFGLEGRVAILILHGGLDLEIIHSKEVQ
jgi:hypothetical protein